MRDIESDSLLLSFSCLSIFLSLILIHVTVFSAGT